MLGPMERDFSQRPGVYAERSYSQYTRRRSHTSDGGDSGSDGHRRRVRAPQLPSLQSLLGGMPFPPTDEPSYRTLHRTQHERQMSRRASYPQQDAMDSVYLPPIRDPLIRGVYSPTIPSRAADIVSSSNINPHQPLKIVLPPPLPSPSHAIPIFPRPQLSPINHGAWDPQGFSPSSLDSYPSPPPRFYPPFPMVIPFTETYRPGPVSDECESDGEYRRSSSCNSGSESPISPQQEYGADERGHSQGYGDPTSGNKKRDIRRRRMRRFPCDHCEAVFERPSSLNQHLRSHTGEKPFQCAICRRRFSVASNARRHDKSCKAEQERRAQDEITQERFRKQHELLALQVTRK